MPSLFNLPCRRILCWAATLGLGVTVFAQTPIRDYQPSDASSEALPKYKEAMDAKPTPNYAAAMAILDTLLAKVPADSFDAALIYQYRLQVFMQQGEFSKVIEPMEKSLALSEAHTPTYFDERTTRELYYYLVQLHFQEGAQTKNTTLAASHFDKADKAMNQWLKITPPAMVTADAQLIYAQLLFSRGMLNPDKPDAPLLNKAIEQINVGLKMSTRPKDNFYVLKLVALNQLDRYAESSELLESLIKLKPDNPSYWQQLAAIYLSLAAKSEEAKDTPKANEYNIRSIITIERAQANGAMLAKKDNYNLIGIYFNIGQFEKAAELLDDGLKKDKIENDPKNWELLALSYQQLQRPLKGIEALKDGAKAYPKSGQMEFLIAQAYTSIDKPEDSLKHIQIAIAKGNLAKPYQAHLSMAYTAYSLQQYDLALTAARKAAEFPDGAKDGQVMVKALEGLINDREAKKNKK